MLNKRFLIVTIIAALVFIISDSIFSYCQFTDFSLDGDLSGTVAPCKAYSKILQNPLGTSVFLKHERYAATNRFFLHWSVYSYFNKAPLFLQSLGVSPIESIYMSCALIKIFVQLLLVLILSMIVKQLSSQRNIYILFLSVIFLSLFQTNGYDGQMGIIDRSAVYFFAYGLPMLVFLIFLYPYIYYYVNKKMLGNKWLTMILLLFLGFIIPFDGSLMCGIASVFLLVLFLSILFYQIKKYRGKAFIKMFEFVCNIPIQLSIPLVVVGFFSLYSFYLGTFNVENDWAILSISERYKLLPLGLFYILTKRLGFPVLIIFSTINTFIVLKNASGEIVGRLKFVLKSLAFFALIYVLFLPLGGYRSYRMYIIRYDTFIPVTLCIFLFYAYSSLLAINIAKRKIKILLISVLILSVGFFTIVDAKREYQNEYEKKAFMILSHSRSNKVDFDCNCNVFSWEPLDDYNYSYESALLLKRWHVTKSVILYRTKINK